MVNTPTGCRSWPQTVTSWRGRDHPIPLGLGMKPLRIWVASKKYWVIAMSYLYVVLYVIIDTSRICVFFVWNHVKPLDCIISGVIKHGWQFGQFFLGKFFVWDNSLEMGDVRSQATFDYQRLFLAAQTHRGCFNQRWLDCSSLSTS